MRRRMMKSKIHRATVTDANLYYVGSITIDPLLMAAADILEHEQVAVVDIDNGNRFETYVICGDPGSGAMCLNGAAARLVHPGDKIIVISYADYEDAELDGLQPRVVHVDARNRAIPPAAVGRPAPGVRPPRPPRSRERRRRTDGGHPGGRDRPPGRPA